MNSIRYIGDSQREANDTFVKLKPGFDSWDNLNCTYGVILSIWNGEEYVIKREKGLYACNLGCATLKEELT